MALTTDVRPVDRLLCGYNVALAVLWAALAGRSSYAPWVFAAHAAAAALPWLLGRAGVLSGAARGLREIYPLLWLCAFWGELGFVRDLLHGVNNDGAIRALDLAVFGVHLDRIWMSATPALWWSEIMHAIYFAYYPLIFLPPVVAGLMGRDAAMRDMMFRLMVTYVACYLVYLAFPVDGPGHTLPRYAGALTDGPIYRMVHGAVHAGDSLGTAFPSSHVAGAVTIALLGWRWFGRGAALVLTAEAAGVLVSTVYTQQHYAIDAVAGVVLALGLQLVVAPSLARALSPLAPSRLGARPQVLTPIPVEARSSGGGV